MYIIILHCRDKFRIKHIINIFAFLFSSKLKENLTELHIIVRTTGFFMFD